MCCVCVVCVCDVLHLSIFWVYLEEPVRQGGQPNQDKFVYLEEPQVTQPNQD